jgi:hypothetical protein
MESSELLFLHFMQVDGVLCAATILYSTILHFQVVTNLKFVVVFFGPTRCGHRSRARRDSPANVMHFEVLSNAT